MSKYYIIDTSSLLNLVRYYCPFDDEKALYAEIQKQFSSNTFILMKGTFNEWIRSAKGIIVKEIPYLKEIKKELLQFPLKKKLHKRIDEHWTNNTVKNRLNEVEYDKEKRIYLDSSDGQMILFALETKLKKQQKKSSDGILFPLEKNKPSSTQDQYIIVTEETKTDNDNKCFKKIPKICEQENITCITLPKLIKEFCPFLKIMNRKNLSN